MSKVKCECIYAITKGRKWCKSYCGFQARFKVPQELRVLEDYCRICDGPCKGLDTHDDTRENWRTQDHVTIKLPVYEETY